MERFRLISSLIRLYVKEEQIVRLIPRHPLIGVLIAAGLGFVIPLCECAIVPVMRRLIEKKLPVRMAIAFMLATPIINPVVLLSTYYAFSDIKMVLWRAGLGFVGAVIIGLLVEYWQKDRPTLMSQASGKVTLPMAKADVKPDPKWFEVLSHTSGELFDVGRYLIFGSLLAAGLNVLVPKDFLLQLGGQGIPGILVMMSLAFIISLCSESDAFVARTFSGNFSGAAVLAFLITGPMIDIKKTLLLSAYFRMKFVVRLVVTILVVCFVLSVLVLAGGLI